MENGALDEEPLPVRVPPAPAWSSPDSPDSVRSPKVWAHAVQDPLHWA